MARETEDVHTDIHFMQVSTKSERSFATSVYWKGHTAATRDGDWDRVELSTGRDYGSATITLPATTEGRAMHEKLVRLLRHAFEAGLQARSEQIREILGARE